MSDLINHFPVERWSLVYIESGGKFTISIHWYYKRVCRWVRSQRCGCLVAWFCYQLIAKPGNKTATSPRPDPKTFFYQAIFSHKTRSHDNTDGRSVVYHIYHSQGTLYWANGHNGHKPTPKHWLRKYFSSKYPNTVHLQPHYFYIWLDNISANAKMNYKCYTSFN